MQALNESLKIAPKQPLGREAGVAQRRTLMIFTNPRKHASNQAVCSIIIWPNVITIVLQFFSF